MMGVWHDGEQNCLTKADGSAEQLMEVLWTGRYVLPEGVDTCDGTLRKGLVYTRLVFGSCLQSILMVIIVSGIVSVMYY